MAAKYLGRVGTLSVALGIGYAVVTGLQCGSAWADTDRPPSSDTGPASRATDDSGPETSDRAETSKQPSASQDRHGRGAAADTKPLREATESEGTDKPRKKSPVSLAPAAESVPSATDQPDGKEGSAPVDTDTDVDIDIDIETDVDTVETGESTRVRHDGRGLVFRPSIGTAKLESPSLDVDGVARPVSDPPVAPGAPPEALGLLGLGRRDVVEESATFVRKISPEPGIDVTGAERQSVAMVAAAATPYVGQPSVVQQVFIGALQVLNFILRLSPVPIPFNLSGSSARIPILGDGTPPFFVTGDLTVGTSTFDDFTDPETGAAWKVYTLTPPSPTGKYVVAVHGGSFIGEVNVFQWAMYADMARDTGATVIVPIFPLAPTATAATLVPQMADFIGAQANLYGAENVSVLGDSSGGAIALSATQLLVARQRASQDPAAVAIPGHLVLLSPVLDVSVSNPAIASVDDPLLTPAYSRANGLAYAGSLDPRDPLVSPLFGDLSGLPPTTVYSGSRDIRSPDVLVLRDLLPPGADFTFELRAGYIHDWMIFGFLPDALQERPGMYEHLGIAIPQVSEPVTKTPSHQVLEP